MKFKAVSLALSTVLLAACTTQAPQTLQQSDLLHRHFVLQSVDGKTIGSDKTVWNQALSLERKCMFLAQCVTALWARENCKQYIES